jgi:hypothetical protein
MSSNVRKQLLEMGAEQGGMRLSIRPHGRRVRPEVCANFEDGEWVPTPKYAKLLGQKTPEERKDDAKATTAAKVEKPAAPAKPATAKKKAVSRKKAK